MVKCSEKLSVLIIRVCRIESPAGMMKMRQSASSGPFSLEKKTKDYCLVPKIFSI
jgi:hypothetical protein